MSGHKFLIQSAVQLQAAPFNEEFWHSPDLEIFEDVLNVAFKKKLEIASSIKEPDIHKSEPKKEVVPEPMSESRDESQPSNSIFKSVIDPVPRPMEEEKVRSMTENFEEKYNKLYQEYVLLPTLIF